MKTVWHYLALVVKAVQGILDQVSALGQQASKIETDELTKISQKNEESRSSSKPEKEVSLARHQEFGLNLDQFPPEINSHHYKYFTVHHTLTLDTIH